MKESAFVKWFAQFDIKATKVPLAEIQHWAEKAWLAAPVTEESPVPKDWVDGKEMTVGQWGQREYDSGYKAGMKNGMEHAAGILMGKALDLFVDAKQDERAKELRTLAEEIKKKAKE
jgi:hypothetical protein